ncbi:hypothetical protein IQ225_16295, partial [Synechocystis salina LEGE 06155]|nr:hypothetical protein [Synechocystis salina LEGE 06155]
ISYAVNGSGYENNLNLSDATDFVFWIPDFTQSVTFAGNNTAAPILLNGVVISNVLTLVFDQQLGTNIPNPDQFSVTVNNASNSIEVSNITVEGNSVVLSLDEIIGQGNLVTVSYTLSSNVADNLSNDVTGNGQEIIYVDSFTTNEILTTFTNPGTVIKTAIASTSNLTNLTSIIGTSGLNYEPTVFYDQSTNQVFAAWVNIDSSQISNLQIPGENYSNSEIINNAIQSSNIYYSILNSNNQWSVAAPIVTNQPGQDTNVTLGLGPNGDLMAAWLNSQSNNGQVTTTINWSTWDNSTATWSTPQALLSNINPDPFTPLTISALG